MFVYQWKKLDLKLGLYHMLGVLVVLNLAEYVDVAWTAVGIGALLAWITILLGEPRNWRAETGGLLVYLVVGIGLSYLGHAVAGNEVLNILTMFVVTFFGILLISKGLHTYMVAWCLVYWYMLSPLFSLSMGLTQALLGHVIGTGLVIFLHFARHIWLRPMKELQTPDTGGLLPLGFAVTYSAVVALTMAIGLGIGARALKADPTLISNAAFNVIGPSALQTWKAALERMLFGTAGILLGFYLGVLFPGETVERLVIAVSSFLALATLRVSFGLVIGALFILLSYQWGTLEAEAGHVIANERMIAELVGVVLAGVAVSFLSLLRATILQKCG